MEVVKKLEKSEDISFLPILQKLVERFPRKFKYKKELGLEYAKKMETIEEAIELFEDILDQNDTLVKAQLGTDMANN